MFGLFQPKPHQYRLRRRLRGWEPQCSYTAGAVDGVFWFPLNENGYWLEPEAFSFGKITKHIALPKELAKRALLRARAINQQHIAA